MTRCLDCRDGIHAACTVCPCCLPPILATNQQNSAEEKP